MESPIAHNSPAEAVFLPPEAWVHILSFVDIETLVGGVGFVSHAFHALASEPQLWRRLILRHFPSPVSAAAGEAANLYEGDADGWRKTFAHRWLERSKRPRFCMLGHVDSGKSTLLGRMLLRLGQVTSEEGDRLSQAATMMGKGSFKYAWCSDRTRDERERAVTIDGKVKECTLTSGREIEIVDVPGHADFNKNAFIAASLADVAMLVVAASMGELEASLHESRSHLGGTRHHLRLAKSLGMSKVIVVVNKMDDRSIQSTIKSRFTAIKDEVLVLASRIGYKPDDLVVVPISAWSGENVVTPACTTLSWYEGPMLFEVMEQMASAVTTASVARRPVFGPTRVSVLRRASKQCITGTDEPEKVPAEEVVVVLVQSGVVREGQVLEAVLPAPIAFSRRSGHGGRIVPKPATVATFTVLSIQRFDKPRNAKWATPRLRRGIVLTAATDPDASTQKRRVDSFTVRLEHTLEFRLRCGFAPSFIIHSAALPCRVEKVLNCWDKSGQEVKFDASDSKAVIQVDQGMSTLVQVKPLSDIFVAPFASCAALGTVLITRERRMSASGHIESVQWL